MKEKLIKLLTEKGIDAEMGVTPIKFAYILQCSKEDEDEEIESRGFWFVESEGDIDAEISNFVKWNIDEYIFACVKDENYVDGKYMVGQIKDLKDYENPDGVHEDTSFMTMSFDELVEVLRQW